MALKTEKKTISGYDYVVTQFGALKGRDVLVTLTKILGPAAAGLTEGGFSEAGVAKAIASWSATADPKDFAYLCDAFAAHTVIEHPTTTGSPLKLELSSQFDTHFAGRYGSMVAWLVFAIRVNYSSFLVELTDTLKEQLEAVGLKKKTSV